MLSQGRNTLGTAAGLLAALLACGPPAKQVVRRYERAGASPPLDGPRAVGPLPEEGEGRLQGGATLARVKTLEHGVEGEAPSNVVSRQMYHLGYFHGVTPRLELGGAMMLAHTSSGEGVARDTPNERMQDTLFGGGALSVRVASSENDLLFLVGTTEVAVWSLPYHQRVTESVDGSAFVETGSRMDKLAYLQLRAGVSGGVHASESVSLAAGVLFQNYPVFQSATLTMYCDPDCTEDAPDVTEMGLAMTPFMWLSYVPGPLSLSLQAFSNPSASHHLGSALPYGGTLVVGYTIDWKRSPRRDSEPEPEPPRRRERESYGPAPF